MPGLYFEQRDDGSLTIMTSAKPHIQAACTVTEPGRDLP